MASERKSIINVNVDLATALMVFEVQGAGRIELDADGLDDSIRTQAMYHGIEQKVRDAAALSRDTKTGKSATPAEKLEAMQEVVNNLLAGTWNAKRAGAQPLNRAALFEAIAEARSTEARPITAAEVEAKFRDRQDEVLRAFLTHADIAAGYARRTARASGKADELLAELEG